MRTGQVPTECNFRPKITAVPTHFIFNGGNGLNKYELGKDKAEQIAANVRFGLVAADGKNMLYSYGQNYGIAKIAPKLKPESGKWQNISGITINLTP